MVCKILLGNSYENISYCKYYSNVQLSLPDFSNQKLIKWSMYVNDNTDDFDYDMNVCKGPLKKLGFILDFGAGTMI